MPKHAHCPGCHRSLGSAHWKAWLFPVCFDFCFIYLFCPDIFIDRLTPGSFQLSLLTWWDLCTCFCLPWVCMLPHLYHRKQKTSLTSHLFHRWESNSLLNDCPEPTIQKAGIYSACQRLECITVVPLYNGAKIYFSLLLAWREKPLNMIKVKRLLKLQTAAIQLFCSVKCNTDWSYFSAMCF